MAADRRKHVGGNIAYFMYVLMWKLLIVSIGLLAGYKKIPMFGPVLFLSGTGNSPEHWNLNREHFWYIQPIAVFLSVFMSIKLSNIISCSLSLHISTFSSL